MKGVKAKDREKLKSEIGKYIIEQTLQDVGSEKSPVTGKGFPGLSKEYKAYKKNVASPKANLELTGNMLDSYRFKKTNTGIEIGIFNSKEAQKADNHNKFSSASLKTNVPARKFVPKKGRDNYRPEIRKGIAKIIQEYQSEENKLSAKSLATAILYSNKRKKDQ